MLKRLFFLLIINCYPVLAIANVGLGCIDSVVIVQIDVHAESGLPSSQEANVNQNQTQNCSGNININNISQVHVGQDGATQNVDVNSEQSSPETNNDMNLPNIQMSIILQQEIIIPDSGF